MEYLNSTHSHTAERDRKSERETERYLQTGLRITLILMFSSENVLSILQCLHHLLFYMRSLMFSMVCL